MVAAPIASHLDWFPGIRLDSHLTSVFRFYNHRRSSCVRDWIARGPESLGPTAALLSATTAPERIHDPDAQHRAAVLKIFRIENLRPRPRRGYDNERIPKGEAVRSRKFR